MSQDASDCFYYQDKGRKGRTGDVYENSGAVGMSIIGSTKNGQTQHTAETCTSGFGKEVNGGAPEDSNKEAETSSSERNPGAQHTGCSKQDSRCIIVTVVCLLLLWLLLLAVIILLWIQFSQLTTDKDELLIQLNNLNKEKVQLLTTSENLNKEREQLQTQYNQLQTSYNNLTNEKDQLQTSYNNLTAEKSHLQKTIVELQNNLTEQTWKYKFGSSLYYYSTERKTWTESRKDCRDRNTDLVIINSQDELNFIMNHLLCEHGWVGLSQAPKEGKWTWVDDTELSTNSEFWFNGQPDNHENNEDCGEVWNTPEMTKLNDRDCSYKQLWICEKRAS